MENRVRYLLLGTGRCGSSLLAAVLAHAGANFDMPTAASWNRRSGEYEHPVLLRAYKWFVRSEKISRSLLPSRFRDYYQRKMERDLDRLLKKATFVKSPELVHMVHTVEKLGYQPKIILSYRRFEGYAASRYRKNGWQFNKLVDEYVDVNSTALLLLHMFGGCAVGYEELVDKRETVWAEALAQVTGIEAKQLLEMREALVQTASPVMPLPVSDPRATAVYEQLRQLKGQVICPPSREVRR